MPGGQIQGLPPMWVWVYKGEEEWTTKTGKKSTARHALNIDTGERLSILDVRKEQRIGQGLTPRPSRKSGRRRTGVVRTTTTTIQHTSYVQTQTSYSFYSLEAAEQFVMQGGIPEEYHSFIVQTKFGRSKIPGKVYEAYKNGKKIKDKFASLSGYLTVERGQNEARWVEIYEKALEFSYNQQSRFYVVAIR